MDFFTAVEQRYSHRTAYTSAPVPKEDLIKILDAGLRAPSGCNAQTTSFIVVTNPDLRRQIAELLPAEAILTAPALIIGITEKVTFDFGLDFEVEDYSAAVENILLAATALGYVSCWYDGSSRLDGRDAAIAKLLDVPEGKQVRTILPIGVPEVVGIQAKRKAFDERVMWKE